MKTHICILICYKNLDHIINCFNSLFNEDIDFIILENYSDSSLKIKKFFETKKILSHIRFDENITNNAVNIFIKDYSEVLNKYDYITFSDCDLRIDNSDQTFREIKKNLEFNDVVVSCVDLNMSNLPKVTGSENWIPNPINITDDYIECDTGIHLMTIKKKRFLGS